jgi:hypothetical protein
MLAHYRQTLSARYNAVPLGQHNIYRYHQHHSITRQSPNFNTPTCLPITSHCPIDVATIHRADSSACDRPSPSSSPTIILLSRIIKYQTLHMALDTRHHATKLNELFRNHAPKSSDPTPHANRLAMFEMTSTSTSLDVDSIYGTPTWRQSTL